jgi:hypothetical protein
MRKVSGSDQFLRIFTIAHCTSVFEYGAVGGVQKAVNTKDVAHVYKSCTMLFLITDGCNHLSAFNLTYRMFPFIVLPSKESLHLPGLPVIAAALSDPMKGTLYFVPQRFKLQEMSHPECGEYVNSGTCVMRSTS